MKTKVGQALSPVHMWGRRSRLPIPLSTVPPGFCPAQRHRALRGLGTTRLAESRIAALAGKPANLYSDLALHVMGDNFEDGISRGEASGNEFRTAPLWGLGQRLFFLHDGRTADLIVAIQELRGKNSEANEVFREYDRRQEADKQDLLNFLCSL